MACGRNRAYNNTYSWQKVNYTPTYYTPVSCAQAGITPVNCTYTSYTPVSCAQESTVNANGCCQTNCCQPYNASGFEWMAAMQATAQKCGCAEAAQTTAQNCGCGCTEAAQAAAQNCGCGCAEAAQVTVQNCGCVEVAQTTECCQKEQFLMDMLRLLLHMLHRSCGNCEA